MPLFAKNVPPKRVSFEDGSWIEIKPLSKGDRDDIQSRYAEMFTDQDLEKLKESDNPTDLPMDIVRKTNEIEYLKITSSIFAWSEKEDVSVENVKGLTEEVFDQLKDEVDKLNNFTKSEEKN